LITQRSEFFRAARSSQWTKPGKPSRLGDDDPIIFSMYVHCLYFSTKDLEERIETDAAEQWAAEEHGDLTPKQILIEKHITAMEMFIDLYILSDKLLDPISANSVIDKLVSFADRSSWTINSAMLAHMYVSTTEGSPLRKLARDWYIHDNSYSWATNLSQRQWAGMPIDFMRDLIIETTRLQEANPEEQVQHVFRDYPNSREPGFYHQKLEEKLEAS
jgi:hypothetical protein